MSEPRRIFLLSPADCGGPRARRLRDALAGDAGSASTIGDAFSRISALYFRGKLAYARRFASDGGAGRVDPIRVITPTRGLLPADHPVSAALLREFEEGTVDASVSSYRQPLDAALKTLETHLRPDDRVVFLGSLATPKYVEPLQAIAQRVWVPTAFHGLGNMQRGSLLLRATAAGAELSYQALASVP